MVAERDWAAMPLAEFIALPDVVPLISGDGSLSSADFRQEHQVRTGTPLAGGYRIDYVERGHIEGMLAESGENILKMIPVVLGLLDQRDLEAAGIAQAQRQPVLDLRGRGTLLGFIDTGLDYTLDCFRYEDGGSKIAAIWDQTLSGAAPAGFYFGAEFSQQQLDEALRQDAPLSAVSHRDTVGHGTLLASVAAGRPDGAAPEAEIIAVKLKQAQSFFYERFLIPEQQANAYSSADVLLGIQYIVNKAAELGRPVAVCLAVGSNMGGHDGFNLLEEFLGRLANNTGLALVCAAGNESQAGHHAEGRLYNSGESQNVELLVGEQAQDIYLTLWNGAADRMSVSLRSPGGELVPSPPVRSGSSYSSNLLLEHSRVTMEYYLPVRGSGDQFSGIRILHPAPGVWTLTVRGEIVLDGAYHLWLPISGFVDEGTFFLAPSPNYTVVTPATAPGVVTCGAYDAGANALYAASSWGPTRLPRLSPDLVAPGVGVGGFFPGGHGYMSGTSVAAALTAGACALMLQWGVVDGNEVTLTTNRIRANLIRGCRRDDLRAYPNVQWGYGRLDLLNSLRVMRPAQL